MRTSIRHICEKIADLDAAGTALVFVRSESFADVAEIAGNYHHKKRVPASGAENNMYEISGRCIREFGETLSAKTLKNSSTSGELLQVLTEAVYTREPNLLFVHDFPGTFGDDRTADPMQSMLFHALHELCLAKVQGKNRTLVLAYNQGGVIPKRLSEFSYLLDVPYPDTEEIKELIEQVLKECMDIDYFQLSVPLMNDLAEAFRGFRASDIANVIELAFSTMEFPLENGANALMQHIVAAKKQILKKTGGLEWMEPECEEVAGLTLLLEWIQRQRIFFHNFAVCAAHQEDAPKGILVAGIPGSGKSLTAKNMARIWGIPLLKMDMGSLMGKYLGESEANVARAIHLAEAISPCVLWIDELEKAFAGVGGDSENNQSVMRIFNSFLTWMQDRKKPCFVFATANDVSRLPPEFLRKERFDDKFYVFMPAADECKEIICSHLSAKADAFSELRDILEEAKKSAAFEKIAQKIAGSVLSYCAEKEKFLTGADISAAVKSAFRALFIDHFPRLSDNDKTLAASRRVIYYTLEEVTEALVHELENTKTYGENMEQVCSYWLSLLDENPFRSASKPMAGAYDISHERFDQKTGEFDWVKKGGNKGYKNKLEEKLAAAKQDKNYDDCLALAMAVALKKRYSEGGE